MEIARAKTVPTFFEVKKYRCGPIRSQNSDIFNRVYFPVFIGAANRLNNRLRQRRYVLLSKP